MKISITTFFFVAVILITGFLTRNYWADMLKKSVSSSAGGSAVSNSEIPAFPSDVTANDLLVDAIKNTDKPKRSVTESKSVNSDLPVQTSGGSESRLESPAEQIIEHDLTEVVTSGSLLAVDQSVKPDNAYLKALEVLSSPQIDDKPEYLNGEVGAQSKKRISNSFLDAAATLTSQ